MSTLRTPATLILLTTAFGGAFACATSDEPPGTEEPEPIALPSLDAGETAVDAAAEADAQGCDGECGYFPETCDVDVLCSTGPFEASMGKPFDPRTRINVIRGRSADDVWVAGALGALAHFDGKTWTRFELGTPETLRALWIGDFGEIAIGKFDKLYQREGHDWPGLVGGSGIWQVARLESCWSMPEWSSAWCATVANEYGKTTGLWRLDFVSPDISERAGIVNDDCRLAGCTQMLAIHGLSADELWAVGMTGAVVRIHDASSDVPTVEAYNSQTWNALRGVWETSDAEAWAVGVGGTIRHYTGTRSWEIVKDLPTTKDLNAVWASSPSDVWVVGNDGVVLHYDGAAWTRVKIAGLGMRRPNLTTIWGASAAHFWIGGDGVFLSLGGKP